MTSKQIRQQFLDFFRSKEHAIVPSSPVVPHDDPTLMFANAGMNQFKPIFLGTVDRNSEFGRLTRAANTQKCIRAGGKHNDLDDVGQDTYHHTFFEMLGNWSFGDYFKKEAIQWAWELLTGVWGIDKTRLHATYFEGDPAEGLEPDSEAAELWRTVTDINPDHIHPGNKKDNFWEMGDTGPCGPCSEIHIDLTPDKSGASLVNKGDARVIELWNLVFIQFNRGSNGKLTPLPAKHVDTGMGFERLCAVLQGMAEPQASACAESRSSMTSTETGPPRELKLAARFSNYDTDVFTPIFDAIQKRTGAPGYQRTLPTDQSTIDNRQSTIMVDVSYRVIADHIRCLTFALTDGAVPSNEGRGYVLRRILRRAVRYGRQYLNMHEPFLCDLVAPLVQHMGDVFPELRAGPNPKRPRDNVKHVSDILRDEEASFLKTLERGIALFNDAVKRAIGMAAVAQAPDFGYFIGIDTDTLGYLPDGTFVARYGLKNRSGTIGHIIQPSDAKMILDSGQVTLSGEDAFKLHDTYGFPIDLTELMAEEQGLTIDIGEYERLMEEAREKARAAPQIDGSDLIRELVHVGETKFRGYELTKLDDVHVEEYLVDGYADSDELRENISGIIVLNETPFYAEQGGQVGDRGIICGKNNDWEFRVENTKRVRHHTTDIILHYGKCVRGTVQKFSKGCGFSINSSRKLPTAPFYDDPRASSIAIVDVDRHRIPTAQNHTATHLLNWALREVLCPPEEREHPHVQQKGSLVDPEKTRFDFSHNKPVTDDELRRIEDLVKERIEAGLRIYTNNNIEVDQVRAREITGLRAVFGEKYPDKVRVVSIGVPVGEEDARAEGIDLSKTLMGNPVNPEWMKYSVEFCGGTHVANTSEVEAFVLTHEEGVAKGVRRLVGISGDAAKKAITLGQELKVELDAVHRRDAGATQGAASPDLPARVAALQQKINEAVIPIRVRHELRDRLAELQKIAKDQEKQAAAQSGEAVMDRVAALLDQAAQSGPVGGVTVVVGEVPAANADALRGAIDWVRNKTEASAVMLACASDGKVTLLAGMSKAVVDRGVKAGDLIREVAPLVGGKGGGRPDMAQGGGTDASGLPNALEQAAQWMRQKLG